MKAFVKNVSVEQGGSERPGGLEREFSLDRGRRHGECFAQLATIASMSHGLGQEYGLGDQRVGGALFGSHNDVTIKIRPRHRIPEFPNLADHATAASAKCDANLR